MSLTKVTYAMIDSTPINVQDYGAVGNGTTNDTAAIDLALADAIAEKRPLFFPAGTYMTEGHVLPLPGQIKIYGDQFFSTTLKKISSTDPIFDITRFSNYEISNLTFDGNNTDAVAIMQRGHYSSFTQLLFKNIGGTSYAIHISGSNVCTYSNLYSLDSCYGVILFDNLTDTLSPQPVYSCLYSNFDNCFFASVEESVFKFAGQQAQILSFSNIGIDHSTATPTNAPLIDLRGTNTANITFENLQIEAFDTGTPFILSNGTVSGDAVNYNIRFLGGKFSTNNITTQPWFSFTRTDGVTISDCYFTDIYATTVRNYIELQSGQLFTVTNNIISANANFYFVFVSGSANIVYEANNNERNYAPLTGVGSNYWSNVSQLSCGNSGMLQVFVNNNLGSALVTNAINSQSSIPMGAITVADDAFYDIFGDGGVTSPGANYSAIISIVGISTISATSNQNVSTFYVQTSEVASTQLINSIYSGTNVELTALANNTAASLAATTNGKLGVQVGGGNVATRFVRVYNRTGASITLSVIANTAKT